jgi:ribonuclease R
MAKRPLQKPQLPTEAEVLEFIQSSPTIVGKREIGRHFGVKGGDKVGLKALLRQMEKTASSRSASGSSSTAARFHP